MAYTQQVKWELLRTLNSPSLSGSYMDLGSPFLYASYICKLVNNSTSLVTISIDGVNAIDVAPAGSFWVYDEQKTQSHEGLPAGTQIYVSGSAGTGNIYLVTQYLATN